MFGLKFVKTNPTTHLMVYRKGQLVRQGAGLSTLYFAPTATLVAIPIESREAPFIFEKVTSDFQSVTVQGQLSYRVANPEKTARSINFALAANGRQYESEDPKKLPLRVLAAAQVLIQRAIQSMPLTEAIRNGGQIAQSVLKELSTHAELLNIGVEVQGVSILAIKPVPETARALEAKAREAILREADEALYERRNAAVENERGIKQSELDTEIAVEQKKRTIRETQLEADASVQRRKAELRQAELEVDIDMESRRKELVVSGAENTRTMAEAEAHRIGALVAALQAADPKVVQALASMGMQPSQLIAQAFGGIADKAEKIGQLNLSPDLLQMLMAPAARLERGHA